jgi:hypothetical protein
MKHIFYKAIACMVVILMGTTLFAQDVIVTADAKKIEAKILEVSKTEIKYKEHDNPDGPTFVLGTNEISSIIYANGKVVLYEASTPAASQGVQAEHVSENVTTITLLSGYVLKGELLELKNEYVAYLDNGTRKTIPTSQIESVSLPNGQIKTYHGKSSIYNETYTVKEKSFSLVSRSGNTYYYEGNRMRGDDYELFLKKNCIDAYEVYRKGNGIAAAGWTLFACGLGLDLGSAIGALIAGNNASSEIIAFSIVGVCCEIACIPTLCVGYAKKHKSADIFNTQCANKTPQAYWSINASKNGIGIAYNF